MTQKALRLEKKIVVWGFTGREAIQRKVRRGNTVQTKVAL